MQVFNGTKKSLNKGVQKGMSVTINGVNRGIVGVKLPGK